MDLHSRVASELGLKLQCVQAALELLEAGNTIPFVTRYRKEATGGLDEEQLRRIRERFDQLGAIEERRTAILASLESQGVLGDELRAAVAACETLSALEDLYLPWRPKRKTRASEARRRGLAPLAGLIAAASAGRGELLAELAWRADDDGRRQPADPALLEELTALRSEAPASVAERFVDGAEVPDAAAALAGARDVVAEWISEDPAWRAELRDAGAKRARIRSRLKPEHEDAARFRDYAEHSEPLAQLPPHRVLAMNRGERLGALSVGLDWSPVDPEARGRARWIRRPESPWAAEFAEALADGLERLLLPALARDLRAEATRLAEEHSLTIYAANLRQLLLQPPLWGRRVMGIDPGFRSGCKVAVVDETGRYLAGATIHPHAPQNRQIEARQTLLELARAHAVQVVAIGNGTASRETEELVAEWIAENALEVVYAVVSEAGASVYSASEEAREEFPELEASLRGNISIARRLLDPLAELVKIDPKSLGVGQYQHDVDARRLGERLDAVVESCVNAVGVDLNTASASLLRHVSGLTRRTSREVVAWRDANGPFRRREQLREVSGIGPAAFRQCAGFLRIRGPEQPLDDTAVHPESYAAVAKLAQRAGLPLEEPVRLAEALGSELGSPPDPARLAALAEEVGLGAPTLADILAELKRPGRDPREELEAPLLRGGAVRLDDLKPGAVLEGVVRNLVDFGVFVDLGLKQDGLVHVSQIAHERVRHPVDVLSVGQRVKVQVLEVDSVRGRVSLSMKALLEPPSRASGPRGDDRGGLRERGPAKRGVRRDDARPLPPGSIAAQLASRKGGGQ